MAETFRKAKIEKYYTSLRIRKSVATSQLKNGGPLTVDKPWNDKMIARQQGYIEALALILKELENEFDLYNPDNPDSDVSKLAKE